MGEGDQVIAEAVRKTNSAGTRMGLGPYQCLGTATKEVPLVVPVKKLWPDALVPELIKFQHQQSCRSPQDVEPGDWILEWRLDWQVG